jgi:uncharacterized membrane protein
MTGIDRPGGTRPAFERSLGRLLIALTYVAVVLLAIGVLLMIGSGISPLSGGPRFDAARLPADLATAAPAGFLWLGLLAIIAAPISRVVAAAVGYARIGDRAMVGVALAILIVIALSIASAILAS